jgi:hypothetical protein
MNAELKSWARALGGEVSGVMMLCPGPGHSRKDRSLSVKMSAMNGGFVVHSFAGDDPIVCRDYVRSKLGMEPFEPHEKGNWPAKPRIDPEPYDPKPRLEPMTPQEFDAEIERQIAEAVEIRVAQRMAERAQVANEGTALQRAGGRGQAAKAWNGYRRFGEAADSALAEPANPLIKDLLDEGALSVIYGDSGSGKTFAALDIAFHVGATGKRLGTGLSCTSRRKAAGGSSGALQHSKSATAKSMEILRRTRFSPSSATQSTFDQATPI